MLWCCQCDEEYPEDRVHLCKNPEDRERCSGYYHCYSCGECLGECKYMIDLTETHVCDDDREEL
jgi:hypothetical protein